MTGDTYLDMPKDHKRCGMCKEIKPFLAYNKSSTKAFGIGQYCKPCALNASNASRRARLARSRAEELRA